MDHLLGLMRIKVVRGVNLAKRDVSSSDPYVVVRMGKQVTRGFFLGFHTQLTLKKMQPSSTSFPSSTFSSIHFKFSRMLWIIVFFLCCGFVSSSSAETEGFAPPKILGIVSPYAPQLSADSVGIALLYGHQYRTAMSGCSGYSPGYSELNTAGLLGKLDNATCGTMIKLSARKSASCTPSTVSLTMTIGYMIESSTDYDALALPEPVYHTLRGDCIELFLEYEIVQE